MGNTVERLRRDRLRKVNTDALEYAACISKCGRELFFTRLPIGSGKPQSFGGTRADRTSEFLAAHRVSAATGFVEAATLSPVEKLIYFHRKDGDRYLICLAARK